MSTTSPCASNRRVALVTAITGQYDTLKQPICQDPNVAYICFVDELPPHHDNDNNDQSRSSGSIWQYMRLDDHVTVPLPAWCQKRPAGCHESDALDARRALARNMYRAKYVKIMTHTIKALQAFDIVVWMDGSFQPTNGRLHEDATQAVSKATPLAVHRHSRWSRVLQDVLYCSNVNHDPAYLKRRYTYQDMLHQYAHYLREGFKDERAYECGILVKQMRHPKLIAFMETWWSHNCMFTYQDQISFGFLVEKHAMPIHVLGTNVYKNTLVGPHQGHTSDDIKTAAAMAPPSSSSSSRRTGEGMGNTTTTTVAQHQRQQLFSSAALKKFKTFCERPHAFLSFDCFDTLISRLCGHPHRVFAIMEQHFGVRHFAKARAHVEALNPKAYTLQAYYDTLIEQHPEWQAYRDMWQRYELVLEHMLGVPITHMQVLYHMAQASKHGAVIVSDTYFTKAQLKTHLGINGVAPAKRTFVSYGGKRDGSMWRHLTTRVIKNSNAPKHHFGDNTHSDVSMANKYGFDATAVNVTYTNVERAWQQEGWKYTAAFCRSMRLMASGDIQRIVAQRWLPIMLACCRLVHQRARQYKCPVILFQSRDMYCIKMLYDVLYPGDTTKYIYISRIAMSHAHTYATYFKSVYQPNALIVDLQGTGTSFCNFANACSPTFDRFQYISLFCDRDKVNDNRFTQAFAYYNEYLERLNYADHGSVLGVRMPSGTPVFFDKEYRESQVEPVLTFVRRCAFYLKRMHAGVLQDPMLSHDCMLTLIERTQLYTDSERKLVQRINHTSKHSLTATLPRHQDALVLGSIFRHALGGTYWLSSSISYDKVQHNFKVLKWSRVYDYAQRADVVVWSSEKDAMDGAPQQWQVALVPWASHARHLPPMWRRHHMVRPGIIVRSLAQKNIVTTG